MTLTKLQTRTAVRQYIDDPDASRWTDGNLDILIRMVMDGLWQEILDTSSYWNSQYDQVEYPFNAPGYIDLRTVADGGDLTQRIYRLQQFISNGRVYQPKDPRDYLLTATVFGAGLANIQAVVEEHGTFQFLGDQLWFHPLGLSAGGTSPAFVELRYSFLPPVFTGLADGNAISFPDGFEHALVLNAAAYALPKAEAEDASQLRLMAGIEKQKLLNFVRRRYHGMTVPFTTEDGFNSVS